MTHHEAWYTITVRRPSSSSRTNRSKSSIESMVRSSGKVPGFLVDVKATSIGGEYHSLASLSFRMVTKALVCRRLIPTTKASVDMVGRAARPVRNSVQMSFFRANIFWSCLRG